ncbi:transposase [Allorhodopirellula heiligendammensis]|uniref:Transposase DDE domain protein n=1 Tax=Allorhodopirellula heiligendammensis TaxID=2714739 RepID=A0A5C6BUZ2_9BACT|nr:transposase [Allorhodopirellula heiligendammensis]TWU15467.1 Transposase DDE domain protein [Allorhodopirellula heiligendammensis]
MALGKRRREQQGEFWISTEKLCNAPRNAFYDRLNQLLNEIRFDEKLEKAAKPYYEETGRKGLAPGIYFRMIFIGYFEDISSQRGIAWRCADSRSLSKLLGYSPDEPTPDHSTLSLTRDRLPMEIHNLAFELILKATADHGLLAGKTLGVDATDLEANASLKSIVRKDNGDDWQAYLRKLYAEETGKTNPTDEELRRFDKGRKSKKKVSNEHWESATDPDSRIGKMKDGRFHLKYKAENAVDLKTNVIVSAEVYHGDRGDTSTIEDTVNAAKVNLKKAGTDLEVEEVVADKGYHSEQALDDLQNKCNARTYIPEPERKGHRTWTDKTPEREGSYRRNRRNTKGNRGRKLQRLRSERVERTFAHLCDTGGARRTWLRGLEKVQKRYMSAAIAHNLGQVMRKLTGAGKPRYLAVLAERAFSRFGVFWAGWAPTVRLLKPWTHPICIHTEFKNAIAA